MMVQTRAQYLRIMKTFGNINKFYVELLPLSSTMDQFSLYVVIFMNKRCDEKPVW